MPIPTPAVGVSPSGTDMNGVQRMSWFVTGVLPVEHTSETGCRTRWRDGTMSHLMVRVTSNILSNTDTIRSRINSADGGMTLSISAASTGTFEDLSGSDALSGQNYNLRHSPATVGGGIVWRVAGGSFLGTTDTVIRYGGGGDNQNLSTGVFLPIVSRIGFAGTEAYGQMRTATPGTLANAGIDTQLNARNGTTTLTLRMNGADSAIAVSMSATTTGHFEDIVNTVAVVDGDYLGPWEATVGGTSGVVRAYLAAVDFITTNDQSMIFAASGADSATASLTRYSPWLGSTAFQGTEANAQTKALTDSVCSRLFIQISGNTVNGGATWRLRINGANATQSISITGTGYFQNFGDEDYLLPDDLVNYQLDTGTGAGSFIMRTGGMLLGPTIGSPGSPAEVLGERNLLTGQLHTANACSDSLIVGAEGTVNEAALVALFSLDGAAHSEARDHTFCVYADNICLNGDVTIDGSPVVGGAPLEASYVTLGTNATLTNERVLTAGSGISLTDGGAGSTITVAVTAAADIWWPAFTPPVNGDFAWVNQGGASVNAVADTIHLIAPASGTANLRLRVKSAPSPPYTLTVALIPQRLNSSGLGNFIGWRQSSDGKLVIFVLDNSAGSLVLAVYKMTNETTFSATYTSTAFHIWGPVWLQITDDNSSRICRWSMDGRNFVQHHTVGRTDFLTGNQILFGCSANSTLPSAMTVLSWDEA